jgi:hypothetical protein
VPLTVASVVEDCVTLVAIVEDGVIELEPELLPATEKVREGEDVCDCEVVAHPLAEKDGVRVALPEKVGMRDVEEEKLGDAERQEVIVALEQNNRDIVEQDVLV